MLVPAAENALTVAGVASVVEETASTSGEIEHTNKNENNSGGNNVILSASTAASGATIEPTHALSIDKGAARAASDLPRPPALNELKQPDPGAVSEEEKKPIPKEANKVSSGLAARMAKLGGAQGIKLPGMGPPPCSPVAEKIQHPEVDDRTAEDLSSTHKTLQRARVGDSSRKAKTPKKALAAMEALTDPI